MDPNSREQGLKLDRIKWNRSNDGGFYLCSGTSDMWLTRADATVARAVNSVSRNSEGLVMSTGFIQLYRGSKSDHMSSSLSTYKRLDAQQIRVYKAPFIARLPGEVPRDVTKRSPGRFL